jgi:hypothetical protein
MGWESIEGFRGSEAGWPDGARSAPGIQPRCDLRVKQSAPRYAACVAKACSAALAPLGPVGALTLFGQWLAPLWASCSFLKTASRLNEAGFWRGGNFMNAAIWWDTNACIPYKR